jgi:hypothetical protein
MEQGWHCESAAAYRHARALSMVDTRVIMLRLLTMLLTACSCVAATQAPPEVSAPADLPGDPPPDCIEAVVLARFV